MKNMIKFLVFFVSSFAFCQGSNHDGIVYESGSNGIYWTSTPNFTFSRYLELRQFGNGAIVAFDSKERSRGAAVRCIRD